MCKPFVTVTDSNVPFLGARSMAMAVLITTQVLTEGRFLTEAIIITIVSFFAYGTVVSCEVRMALTLVLFFKRGTFW